MKWFVFSVLFFGMSATNTAMPMDPFPDLILKEVAFTGGIVGASSRYDSSTNYQPANAFQRHTDLFWHSGKDANGAGAEVVSFPHLIWYEFKTPFVPGRVSFRPRSKENSCGDDGFWCGATKWQFIGTNDQVCDETSAWTVLCEDLSGRHFERQWQSKYCTVEKLNRTKFRCLGISVLDATGWKAGPGTSMSGIRMWERIN